MHAVHPSSAMKAVPQRGRRLNRRFIHASHVRASRNVPSRQGRSRQGLSRRTIEQMSGNDTVDLRAARLIATIPAADLDRARAFYVETLGFAIEAISEAGILCQTGDGRVLLYTSAAPPPGHTLAGFEVQQLEPVIATLMAHGVRFEEYDLPGLQTVDHVAWIGPERAAWFRDSEGNILSISEPWRASVP
jgi:catechol 2,3-dioxygenase-like lactoylglutathione lyase family enzyme